MTMPTIIAPQPGPQTAFLATDVDVAVYGGAAGGGKSYALLLDALYYAALKPVADFGAVIFRRTNPQITAQGGLWDESAKLYPLVGGTPKQDPLRWEWPQYKTRIRFAHMQYESDRFNWQGSQIPYIGFDEGTHFTADQVFYMLSRMRSTCGVKPRMRLTTNPDADSWMFTFLAPWVDPTYPDPAAPGEVRWFYRDSGAIIWLRSPDARPSHIAAEHLKTGTFIPAKLSDNPALMQADPAYEANLMALPLVERQRLLYGDWTIRPSGNLFKRHWFPIVDAPPAQCDRVVRYWDLAGTAETGSNDPDWTAGVKIGRKDGQYYVLDVQRERVTPQGVKALVRQMADLDGRTVSVYMEQEPGSSGKTVIDDYRTLLTGFHFTGVKTTGDKTMRALPASSQAEGGNVHLVRAHWNEAFLNELAAFPMTGVHDDQVDAFSGAMDQLRFLPTATNLLSHLEARATARAEWEQTYLRER